MLRALFDPKGEFNSAEWVLLSDWSGWALAGVFGLIALAGYLSWRNARARTSRQRMTLRGLRLLTLALFFLMFLQPGARLEHVNRVRNHVVVLVDESRSMRLPGADAATRLEDVKALLESAGDVLAGWREAHQVDFFGFSDRARPIAEPAALNAHGDATRIISALESVASRFQPEDLAAVVLISDGADTGLMGEMAPGGEAPGALSSVLRRLGAPVHAIFTGPDTAPRDVAITEVKYDDFAFARNAVSIEAEISVTGYQDLTLPVILRRGDKVLGTRSLHTRAGERSYRFEFEFVPDKTGKAVFTLEVAAGPNEQILVNNRRRFVARVIRDKIRVLQVVGRPSWDERFLRKLLKKNPNVDLISFFILRTSASIEVAHRNELSLIPFPTQELFEEQLGSFDLIVFQNFTYRGYHMRQYLPLIRDYVRNGGGFVMIGGDLSFASGGYSGTPIAEFLPMALPDDANELIYTERFSPALTKAGKRHPITALSLVPEENAEIWSKLPPLSGGNRTLAARPEATVLLTHPSRKAGGQAAPIATTMTFGQGRVLALTTDSSWSWGFQQSGAGGDNRHYYKFWGNAIRWLINDPALKPVRVEADRDRYPLGAEVTLATRVVGRDYTPVEGASVEVIVEREWFEGGQPRRAEVLRTRGLTGASGELLTQLKPKDDGAFFVTSRADIGEAEAMDTDVFVVSPDPIELRQTAARADTLKQVAKLGGGQFRTLDEGLADLKRVEPRVLKVNRRKDIPLWSSGWWLLLGLLLPSAEWFLRRRWGLL